MICPIAEVKSGAENFAPFNGDLIVKSTDGHWRFTNVGHLLILKITVRRENQGEKRENRVGTLGFGLSDSESKEAKRRQC